MNDLQIKAALAGLFFGMWPLLMNRSGLSGNVSSSAFALGCFLGTLPFALYEGTGSFPTTRWIFVIFACATAAFGLLSFNGMLAKATPQQVGLLIVLMVVTQILVPALYDLIVTHSMNVWKLSGFVAAAYAAYALTR